MILKSFIPTEAVKTFALWASFPLTILYLVFIVHCLKLPHVKHRVSEYSRRKKLFLSTLLSVFIYGLFWVNIAISVPQLFTLAFGQATIDIKTVSKSYSVSRRSCDHKLRIKKPRSNLVYTCINDNYYDRLPDKEFEVEFLTLQSNLGTHYKTFTLVNNGR